MENLHDVYGKHLDELLHQAPFGDKLGDDKDFQIGFYRMIAINLKIENDRLKKQLDKDEEQ